MALAVLITAGCSLINPPDGPIIPTPPATVAAVSFSDLPLVRDPTSSISPAVDPDIQALINAVSEQQLTAYVQTLEGFGTRNTFSETQREDYGIGAARRWIYNEFLRVNGGALQVEYDDFPTTINGFTTSQRNVVATLPGIGNHPGAIVIMAHYDSRPPDPNDGASRAPGANDNAAGVALLLELARLMSSRPWNQTIIFASFAAEEQGSYGSRHFVQDKMLEGRVFDAAIGTDIVGGRTGIPQSIRLFAQGPETSPSQQFGRYMDYISGLYLPTFRVDIIEALDREGRWGDHREFINAGVAGVRLTESVENRDHQHSGLDTWDQIDFSYLKQVVQINLAVLGNFAGAPAPPEIPTIAPMAEPGAFIISWLPDPLAAGYAMSFRPVGSPELPPFRFVSAAEAGNVALTGLDSGETFAVSIAAIDSGGRTSGFSPEVIIGPDSGTISGN